MSTTNIKKTTKTALNGAVKEKKTALKPKKSLLDYAKKFQKKPLFSIAKEDEDLVFGTNMMTRLMLEK